MGRVAKARRIAGSEGLGRVIAVFGVVPGPLARWAAGVPAVLLVLLTILAPVPGLSPVGNLVGLGVGLGVLWLFFRALSGDGLAVAEGGLLIGSFLPFLSPYRLRWSDVDVSTLRFLGNFDAIFAVIGQGYNSALRATKGVGVALSLAGPAVADARLAGAGAPLVVPPDASTGGNMWYFGCGERRRAAVANALREALDAAGRLPAARGLDGVVTLSPDPRTCLTQVPGLRLSLPPTR